VATAWTRATVRRMRRADRVPYGADRLAGRAWLLTMPDLPPSLNAWQRWHWARRREETVRLATAILALARSARIPPLHAAEASVRCYFPDRRRRDPTNYAHWKPFWDALVRAGVLDDDDAAHLHVAAFELLVDEERPRSEVELRPV
jgi:hypothetical protein